MKKHKFKLPDIYKVIWVDSQSSGSWIDDPDISQFTVHSIGYLIFQNKKLIRLSLCIGENEDGTNRQFNCTIAIPKRAILKMKKLKSK